MTETLYRFSPTQIKNWRLCKRKWAFEKIEGIKPPPSPKMVYGIDRHSEAELWLRHGQVPGPVVAQGIRSAAMPTPGPHLLIEEEIELSMAMPDTRLVGYIDCVEPPNDDRPWPLVIDHKFTSDLRWAMKPEELAVDPQALIYVAWAMRHYGAHTVTARWLYYAATNPRTGPRRPAGFRPVEHDFHLSDVAHGLAWAVLMADVAGMRQAKEWYRSANTDAPPTPSACGAFGGCPFRARCDLDPGAVIDAAMERHDKKFVASQCDNMLSAPINKETTGMPTLFDNLKKMQTQRVEDTTATDVPDISATAPTTAPSAPTTAPSASTTAPSAPTTAPITASITAPSAPTTVKADNEDDLMSRLQAMADKVGINPPEGPAPAECENIGTDDGYDWATKARLTEIYIERAGAKPPAKWSKAELVKRIRDAVARKVSPSPDQDGAKSGPAKNTTSEPPKLGSYGSCLAPEETPPAEVTAAEARSPAAAPLPVAGDRSGLMVLFDCALRKGPGANGHAVMINLADWIKPIADAVADDNGVKHFGLIDFAKGGPMLAVKVEQVLEADGLDGVLLVDSYSLEGRVLKDVLIRHAVVAVQGVR